MTQPGVQPFPSFAGGKIEPFRASWQARLLFVVVALYAFYALGQLDFSQERFIGVGQRRARFLARMFPPNYKNRDQLLTGFIESMQIAVLATFGVLVSLPIAVLGARNLMPGWATWPARLIVTLCRAFNPVIVAIVFIKAVGFGGVGRRVGAGGSVDRVCWQTVQVEAIEEISMKQIEAVRAISSVPECGGTIC